jgi:hypothetical protein
MQSETNCIQFCAGEATPVRQGALDLYGTLGALGSIKGGEIALNIILLSLPTTTFDSAFIHIDSPLSAHHWHKSFRYATYYATPSPRRIIVLTHLIPALVRISPSPCPPTPAQLHYTARI